MLRTNSKTKATQHLHNLVSKPSRSALECERRVGNDLGNVTALSNALAELILVSNPHTLVETKCRSAFQIRNAKRLLMSKLLILQMPCLESACPG